MTPVSGMVILILTPNKSSSQSQPRSYHSTHRPLTHFSPRLVRHCHSNLHGLPVHVGTGESYDFDGGVYGVYTDGVIGVNVCVYSVFHSEVDVGGPAMHWPPHGSVGFAGGMVVGVQREEGRQGVSFPITVGRSVWRGRSTE